MQQKRVYLGKVRKGGTDYILFTKHDFGALCHHGSSELPFCEEAQSNLSQRNSRCFIETIYRKCRKV